MRKRKRLKMLAEEQEQALLHQGSQEAATSSSNSDEEETFSGLFVFGEVVDRTKRTIPNTSTEVVTYTVQDNEGRRYYVDEYIQPNEQEKCYDRGEYVEIPVFVKTFRKRNGDIGYSFCVQQESRSHTRGVPF